MTSASPEAPRGAGHPTVLDARGPSRRYLTMVVASLSLIVLSCVAFLVPVPYVTMRPGPAFDAQAAGHPPQHPARRHPLR